MLWHSFIWCSYRSLVVTLAIIVKLPSCKKRSISNERNTSRSKTRTKLKPERSTRPIRMPLLATATRPIPKRRRPLCATTTRPIPKRRLLYATTQGRSRIITGSNLTNRFLAKLIPFPPCHLYDGIGPIES